MPPTCIAPGCDSGNPRKQVEGEHRHFFAVPKDEVMQDKWKRCIPITDVHFTKNSKICDLHFEDEFILRFYETIINGETVKIARGKVSLADGAYPTKFPDLEAYLAKKPRKRRKLLKCKSDYINSSKQIPAPTHSKLEEITDQVEATQGKPPDITLLAYDENAHGLPVALGVGVNEVAVEGEQNGNSHSNKKSPSTNRLFKARDRIYYLTRQCNRLKKRVLDLKAETRKYRKQAMAVVESLQGLKSLPRRQQLIFEQAILQTQQKRGGMRYSPEWIADCIQLKIRSASVYEYLRKNQYMPLPNPGTLYNFVKQRKIDLGIDLQLLETLKEKPLEFAISNDQVSLTSEVIREIEIMEEV